MVVNPALNAAGFILRISCLFIVSVIAENECEFAISRNIKTPLGESYGCLGFTIV